MGMARAFDPGKADFSGLAEPRAEKLHLGRVFHKSYVKVDEKGAPPKVSDARLMMYRVKVKPFIADHPFLFFIRDVRSGLILFMGRVADPTTN
jgi:serpin B